jgi:hypothetical protein
MGEATHASTNTMELANYNTFNWHWKKVYHGKKQVMKHLKDGS